MFGTPCSDRDVGGRQTHLSCQLDYVWNERLCLKQGGRWVQPPGVVLSLPPVCYVKNKMVRDRRHWTQASGIHLCIQMHEHTGEFTHTHTQRGWGGETCLSSLEFSGPHNLFSSLSVPPMPLQTLFLSHGARWLVVEFSISVHIYPSSPKFMRFWHGLNKRLYYIPYLFSKVMIATISSLLLRNNEHGLKCFSPSGPGMFYMHCLFCSALLIWYFIH